MSRSLSRGTILIILVIGLFILVLGRVLLLSTSTVGNGNQPPPGFPDDRKYVSGQRGNRILALRRPKRAGEPETQVIFVFTDRHAQTGILHGPYKTVQLSSSVQQSLEQLQHTWCAQTPIFGSTRDDMLY